MQLDEFLRFVKTGAEIPFDSDYHDYMNAMSSEAMKIQTQLNTEYHTPAEVRNIFEKLTGKKVDETFCLFAPFTTDFGKNITVGKNVFINSGCRFQDHGGITIDDGAQIGHNVVIATLNHALSPQRRANVIPKAVHIGKNVWIGSGSVILPGVTIGDNAVVGAGSVVTHDVAPMTVAAGNPAKKIKDIE
ncbi:MAG: sugar O-acetyltransferase [Oscillospiraceae bacterium]|nr:sugar O-acetyltransferase [Oscillospiraceae bacterium]